MTIDNYAPERERAKVEAIAEAQRAHRDGVAPERITAEGGDFRCLCGNTPVSEGFSPCEPNGAVCGPSIEGPWNEHSYLCGRCGRIIDQETLAVTGRREVLPTAAEYDAAEGW